MIYIIIAEALVIVLLYLKANQTINFIRHQNEKMSTIIADMTEIISRLKNIIKYQNGKK